MSSLKTANAIASLSALVIATAPWCARLPYAPIIYPAAGIGLVIAAEPGKRKEDEQAASPLAWVLSGWGTVPSGLVSMFKGLQNQSTKGVHKVAVIYDIPVLPEFARKTEDSAAIKQAFIDIHKRSFLAIANTGGGKTWFLHQSAGWAIEQGEHVIICDRSYGKRGQHWHGLPVYDREQGVPGIVFEGSPDDLESCVEMFFQERERRAKETKAAAKAGKPTPVFKRWALYLPERTESLIEYRDKYGDESANALSKAINSLLRDGHGYNVFLRSDAQSAATGEIEVSEGMRKNLHWVFFGDAVETKELGKVGIDKEWVGKVEKARNEHGKYLGLALIEGKPKYIKAPKTEYDFSSAISTDQAVALWIQEHQQSIAQAINDRARDGQPASPTALFDQFKDSFPVGFKSKGSDNPYWQAFKLFIENQENN